MGPTLWILHIAPMDVTRPVQSVLCRVYMAPMDATGPMKNAQGPSGCHRAFGECTGPQWMQPALCNVLRAQVDGSILWLLNTAPVYATGPMESAHGPIGCKRPNAWPRWLPLALRVHRALIDMTGPLQRTQGPSGCNRAYGESAIPW